MKKEQGGEKKTVKGVGERTERERREEGGRTFKERHTDKHTHWQTQGARGAPFPNIRRTVMWQERRLMDKCQQHKSHLSSSLSTKLRRSTASMDLFHARLPASNTRGLVRTRALQRKSHRTDMAAYCSLQTMIDITWRPGLLFVVSFQMIKNLFNNGCYSWSIR